MCNRSSALLRFIFSSAVIVMSPRPEGADPVGVGVGVDLRFFSMHYRLNQMMDFFQTYIDTFLGQGNELIRFR